MIGEYIELSNGIEGGAAVSIGNLPEIGVKKNLAKYKATIVARNNEVCTIEGSIQKNNYETVANFGNEVYTIKSYGQNNTIDQVKAAVGVIGGLLKGSVKDTITSVAPQIYDQSGNMIGKCEVLWGGTGSNKFLYGKYIINNNNLYAYELSPNTTEILYCIYNDQNQMVATISRAMKISHGHARYTIYSCNDAWFKYVALITACWALAHTEEDGGPGSYQKKAAGTLIPELHEKYNPTFIDQVKQKEGIHNLPENMQLVKEKIKESKKGADMKLYMIIVIVVIIGLAFIFLGAFK